MNNKLVTFVITKEIKAAATHNSGITIMKLKTRKIHTRSMIGNKDVEGVIFEILANKYGMNEVCNNEIDFEASIYSDGFIYAIESNLQPIIESIQPVYMPKKYQEYHHFIYNDECYVMYFEEA